MSQLERQIVLQQLLPSLLQLRSTVTNSVTATVTNYLTVTNSLTATVTVTPDPVTITALAPPASTVTVSVFTCLSCMYLYLKISYPIL